MAPSSSAQGANFIFEGLMAHPTGLGRSVNVNKNHKRTKREIKKHKSPQ